MTQNGKLALIAAGTVIGVYLIIQSKEANQEQQTDTNVDVHDTQPVVVPNNPNPTPVVVKPINKNLVLKKGIIAAAEVKELQKLLGLTGSNVDGIFFTQTENLLKARKGVTAISLNQFASKSDVPKVLLTIGNRVMANVRAGVKTYENEVKANGEYYTNMVLDDTIDYGDEIGTIVRINADKTWYVVKYSLGTSWNQSLVWVRASEVVKI